MQKQLLIMVILLLITVGFCGCNETSQNSNLNEEDGSSSSNQYSTPPNGTLCASLVPENVQNLTFIRVKTMDCEFIGALDGVKATYTNDKGNELELEIYKFENGEEVKEFTAPIDSSRDLDESQTANYNWLSFGSGLFGFYILGEPGTTYSQVENLAKATGYYP